MYSTDSDSFEEEAFDWNKYLEIKIAESVPSSFFHHICKSEQNGIESGSVVEVENANGYWFASVCSSEGVSVKLRYFGDVNDIHDFWLELKSSRIHYFNWGSENNKKLVPPDYLSHVNPKIVRERVRKCEHFVPNRVLQMRGAPIYKIFESDMFIEVQDKNYPYHVWISKILRNVGGRLLLKMQGESCPETEPFWLFYLDKRVFPFGWAEQKGLPWRVKNMNSKIKIQIGTDCDFLLDVLKPEVPESHGYKVGEMLEVLNPFSLMVFHVATIIKIYDNRYFKVELNDKNDVNTRVTFMASKGNPYLFNAGWAKKHDFLLKPPSDFKTLDKFCWSEYSSIKNFKLARINNTVERKFDSSLINMKLEAVDPVERNCIRVATIKGFADHWMFLSFDRSSSTQELLHVRSVYSNEVFPAGWCNKHNYPLRTSKSPYVDYDVNEDYYYASDVEVDFNVSDKGCLAKYPNYVNGEFLYHYRNVHYKRFRSDQRFKENLEKFIENILNDDRGENSNVSKTGNNNIAEDAYDAFILEEEIDCVKSLENVSKTINDGHSVCIYFNKDCYSGVSINKRKTRNLPTSIGPGPASKILQEAITIFIGINSNPVNTLKKIKTVQNTLFDEPGGVELLITFKKTLNSAVYSENLRLPETAKTVQKYCSSLCHLFGICQYFMTTEHIQGFHECNVKKNEISRSKHRTEDRPETVFSTDIKCYKRKATDSKNCDIFLKNEFINKYNEIIKVAERELDWSNRPLVKRFKYYMECLINCKSASMMLDESLTSQELAIVADIQAKKKKLRVMDEMAIFIDTRTELGESDKKKSPIFDDWKSFFENYYRKDLRFKNNQIDIGYFTAIKVTSNPKYWSPTDVYIYLSHDPFCTDIGNFFLKMEIDGLSFMLLNQEILLQHLQCTIHLTIRLMCHVAEVNYTFYKEYNT